MQEMIAFMNVGVSNDHGRDLMPTTPTGRNKF